MTSMPNLRIRGDRLWDTLTETAQFGGTAKGGICRLTLTDTDRKARDWFGAQARALGCDLAVDDMGVMYARRPGRRSDIAPIAFGSHLDTQPTGGKFDGALGTLAALEVLRTLHDAEFETYAPLEIVNWTNEEGSRFSPALLASGAFAGVFDRDWAMARGDRSGTTFGAALAAIGYRGEERCGARRFSAFFELHIEQGPLLEREGKDIGVVTGVQGVRWFTCVVTGQDAHTGTTPMAGRRDALLAAARAIGAIDAIAKADPPAVATVGSLEVKPNSPNVIPGEVAFTIDLRHPQREALDRLEAEIARALATVGTELGVGISHEKIWDEAPIAFDAACVAVVRAAAERSGYAAREIVSGAMHDAAYVSRVAPSAMIFVPCRDGISHNEAEFTSPEQCARGAQVLLDAVLAYDRLIANREGGD